MLMRLAGARVFDPAHGEDGRVRDLFVRDGRIAEAINAHPNVSADVGQILFGQTATASGDSMAQFRNARLGSPRKYVVMDIECDAGCGVVSSAIATGTSSMPCSGRSDWRSSCW